YSEGYVLGVLSEVASRGIIIQTLEGSIKLGRLSSRGNIVDPHCFQRETGRDIAELRGLRGEFRGPEREAVDKCSEPFNPWAFSHLNQRLLSSIEQVGTNYVLVFFRSYLWIPFIQSD